MNTAGFAPRLQQDLGQVAAVVNHDSLGVGGITFIETERYKITVYSGRWKRPPKPGDQARWDVLNRSVVHFADTTTSVACRVVRYTPKPPDELAALEREQPGIARLCHFVYVVANVGFGVALLLFLDMSSQVAGSLAAGTLSVIEVLFFIAISAACYLAATKRQEVTAAWRSALFDEWIGVEALPAKAIRS